VGLVAIPPHGPRRARRLQAPEGQSGQPRLLCVVGRKRPASFSPQSPMTVSAASGGLLLTRAPRRGEACGLKWEDVKLDSVGFQIVHTRVMVGASAGSPTPKTGSRGAAHQARRSARDGVPQSPQAPTRGAHGGGPGGGKNSGYVFVDELGAPRAASDRLTPNSMP